MRSQEHSSAERSLYNFCLVREIVVNVPRACESLCILCIAGPDADATIAKELKHVHPQCLTHSGLSGVISVGFLKAR